MNCEECTFCEYLEGCKNLQYNIPPCEREEERVFDTKLLRYVTKKEI